MPNKGLILGFGGKKKKKEPEKDSRFACAFSATLVERCASCLAEALTAEADCVEEWGEVVVGGGARRHAGGYSSCRDRSARLERRCSTWRAEAPNARWAGRRPPWTA